MSEVGANQGGVSTPDASAAVPRGDKSDERNSNNSVNSGMNSKGVEDSAAAAAAASPAIPAGQSPLYRHVEVPPHLPQGHLGSSNDAGDRPLGSVLSLDPTPSSSSDHASQPQSAQNGALQHDEKAARGGATAARGREAGYSPQLNAAALADTSSAGAAAVHDSNASAGTGNTGAEVDSSVATPCFSTGMRSPLRSPTAHSLPLRPKPQRFATLDDEGEAVDEEEREEEGFSAEVAPPAETSSHQHLKPERSHSSSSSTSNAEALAATVALDHDEASKSDDVAPHPRKKAVEEEEVEEEKATPPVANRKRPKSSDDDESEEDDDEDHKMVQSVLPWCALPSSARDSAAERMADTLRSSEATANADVARALAMFSSSIHGGTGTQAALANKPSLSPHYSYMPWRLSESNSRDGGNEVSLPSFDTERARGDEEEAFQSPPPPPPRRPAPQFSEKKSSGSGSSSAGSVVKTSGGGDKIFGALVASPMMEPSAAASITSDPAVLGSGSYGSSGVMDVDTAALAALAAMNAPAARFGGGGVLRHNPAYLAFSGSGSGSQGGEGTIDRSVSSHFSATSRGAASLSPPYLAADEENGELAVAFRRDGAGRDQRHHGGGAGQRGGLQTSPSHQELNNTLDETFGTMVSTMSTTFSTTTNSAAEGDPSSPGDAHRLQLAAQMRQALLQTLGLGTTNSGSSATGTSNPSRQRSERAASLTSNAASSAEATTPSGAGGPISPLRDNTGAAAAASANAQGYAPRLPHLGHAVGGGSSSSAIATPPESSRNPSFAAGNLASSASLSTTSMTSPNVAPAQGRSVAAMFAAMTTPSPRVRSTYHGAFGGSVGANGGGGGLHMPPTYFDIDSGDEDEEGKGDDRGDHLRLSMSGEASRMLSVSISNPLMNDEMLSSEISSSQQQLTAAVQPPPNLQLAYQPQRQSLTGMFTDLVSSRRSPMSATPSFYGNKTATTTTADDLFSNSTSSLLPPVLQSTARGGEQSALEAAAAEAVREVDSDNYAAAGEAVSESGSYAMASAAPQPPPLTLSPVAYESSPQDSDAGHLRTFTPSNAGVSPLSIEGVRCASGAAAARRRSSTATAHPSSTPSPHSPTSKESAAEAASPQSSAHTNQHQQYNHNSINVGEEEGEEEKNDALAESATAEGDAASADRAAMLASPAGDSTADTTASPVTGLEWSTHSLSVSGRPRQTGGGDDALNPSGDDEDDVSGTATTRAPNSTSSSQFQIVPVGSMTFGEAPELLLDAGPIHSHSRRDFVNSSASASSISGALAAAAAAASAQQGSHVDPTAAAAASTSTTAHGGHGRMASRPGSTTTTTTNGDLSASTSTRMWSDNYATVASGLPRRYGEDAAQEEAESPVNAQPPQRLGQFAAVPVPRFTPAAFAGVGAAAAHRRRGSSYAGQLDLEDGESGSTANPSGTSSLTPSASPQQMSGLGTRVASSDRDALRSNTGGVTSNVFGESINEPEEDEWGEPMTSAQPQPVSPPAPHSPQEQEQQVNKVEEEGDDDDFAEPTVAPPAPRKADKHVDFADPTETQFVDPPASPWAKHDFFYAPDYTHMEFKSTTTTAADNASPHNEHDDNDDVEASEEDRELLRSVPHFRFRHRCADVHGSPLLQQPFAALSAPSWDAWSRGSKLGRREQPRNEAASSRAAAQDGQEPVADQDGEQAADGDAVAAERAPRVFFTKERLAARAALMEARRANLRSKTEAKSEEATANAPAADSAAAATTKASAKAETAGLRINLAPPPPAAATTIAVALPDFAAPVIASSPPAAGNTGSDGGGGGLLRTPPPSTTTTTVAAPPTSADDDDDGFGGWVQQQQPSSTAPTPAASKATPPPATLTKERCAQLAAELKKGGKVSTFPASTFSIDTAHADEIMRTIFNEDGHLAHTAAAPPAANSGDNGSGETSPCLAIIPHDGDESSEALGATTSTAPLTPGDSYGVDRVLEALSFTSLAHRSGTAVTNGSSSAATTPVAANGNAPALEDGGYVVPWRTRTSATAAPAAALAPPPSTTAAVGTPTAEVGDSNDRAATAAASEERQTEEEEDASLRLTRHLLFPAATKPADTAAMMETPISAYMGSRRLPDAPTAAQWTERDVLLAVQQEQRRMAQENEGAVETERLEDVLRLSS